MPTELTASFVDTNILVYALDISEGGRHNVAKELLKRGFEGKEKLAVSNQILAEFGNVLLTKYEKNASKNDIVQFIDTILVSKHWLKITYTPKAIKEVIEKFDDTLSYWDSIIAQTMLENGITKIYTENTKDFSKIKGIKAVNPFKK